MVGEALAGDHIVVRNTLMRDEALWVSNMVSEMTHGESLAHWEAVAIRVFWTGGQTPYQVRAKLVAVRNSRKLWRKRWRPSRRVR